MKKLLKIVVGMVVVLVILLTVAVLMLDSGAKSGIETIMSERLGVATTLDDISISLFNNDCEMKGFAIANPKGYSQKPFFSMGRGFLAVSGTTLMDDVIRVPKLELSKIRVNLEQGASGGNYEKLLEALAKGQDDRASGADEKRFIIDEVVIVDTVVNAQILPSSGAVGQLVPDVTLNIPEIRLRNVGSESDKGALLSDVASQVMSAVFVQIGGAADQLPGAIGAGFNTALGQLPNLGDLSTRLSGGLEKGVSDLITGGTQGVGKELEKMGEGLKKGLGGLLGGAKKK